MTDELHDLEPNVGHRRTGCLMRENGIKAELILRNHWETRPQAEGAIFQHINGFYNPRRRHSSLVGKSLLAFERKAA
jgi:transposase InsO family protein